MNDTTAPAPQVRRDGSRVRRPLVLTVALAAVLSSALGCAAPAPTALPTTTGTAADTVACPARLAGKAACYNGQDETGAYYTMAVPNTWNRALVVHAHGGPDPSYDASSPTEDLERWSVMVEQGYAWAGSSYRRGGYGVRMAAKDTEDVRQRFVDRFGAPDRTYLHGQSFGGNVAAKVAETHGRKSGTYEISALDTWVRSGDAPTPDGIAASCDTADRVYRTGCFYDPDYTPAPLSTRITPRDASSSSWPVMTAQQEEQWSGIDGVGIAP